MIVAIILAYLGKTGRKWLAPAVYAAIAASLAASAALGYLLSRITESEQALWEGLLGLAAAAMVTSLVVHMWRTAPRMKQEMHAKLEKASSPGSKIAAAAGVFLFTVLMISREGMETALMLLQVRGESRSEVVTGVLLGAGAAAALAVAWGRFGHLINLKRFFQITGVFLLLFVAQILVYSFIELSGAGVIPGSERVAELLQPFAPDGTYGKWFSLLIVVGCTLWLAAAWLKDRNVIASAAARWHGLSTSGSILAVAAAGVLVLLLIGGGYVATKAIVESSAAAVRDSAVIRFANKTASPANLNLDFGKSLTLENGESITLVFEGNGMYPGEITVPAGGRVTVATTGLAGDYKIVDERGMSGASVVTLGANRNAEPLEREVSAVGALTVLEGHVRTSKDLSDRGIANEGPTPDIDRKRAGKHAGHPQMELLMGSDPDSLNLQKLLKEKGVFDSLNNALTEYVAVAGKPEIPLPEIEQKYKAALAETERARRAIGGDAYDTRNFRSRVAKFVLDTTAGEYATATEGGRIAVTEAGVPGKDNFIEYQDGRGFLKALRDFVAPINEIITPDALAAFDKLQTEIYAPLNPANPENPVPASDVKALTDKVARGISAG